MSDPEPSIDSRTHVFVVREPGKWSVTTVPGDDTREVGLDEVLRLVDGPVHTGLTLAAEVPDGAAGAGPDTVEPVWCFVAQLEHGHLRCEVGDGTAEVLLDADDVRLLDALAGPTDVASLPPVPERGRRLARLLESGRIRATVPPASSDPASSPPFSDAAAGGAVAAAGAAPAAADPSTEGPTTDDAPSRAVVRSGSAGWTALASRWVQRRSSRRSPGAPADAVATRRAVHDDRRVPVYAVWDEEIGPLLSLGMLTAAARHLNGGELQARYEIRRPELATSFLADLERRDGPAVLLCSDYVWSLERNLQLARLARSRHPQLLVVHGGPSAPKYPGDAADFLDLHGDVAHVLVRGEGEATLFELLRTLGDGLAGLDPDRLDREVLASVHGITFRDGTTGEVVRTEDRERIADLDSLPSPYLSGEFDDIDPGAWFRGLSIETNRGCPYGCTFCDWGSATLSRIRKFDLDRVAAEIDWASSRGVQRWQLCDANFGILARDVEIAGCVADARRRHGAPEAVAITPAKNTTRHLSGILDELLDVNIEVVSAISLQTTDEQTLAAVDRSNISTDAYLELAADLRRRGVPLQGDVLLGLPGQTYESFRQDLQFFLDHEIMTRTWLVQLLPNSPMNAPDYRRAHGIVVNDNNVVISTSTFDAHDRLRMGALHRVETITERFGLLRHVLRWLQWDHDVPASSVMDRLVTIADERPGDYPLVTWVLGLFDRHPTVPVGWGAFYEQVRELLEQEFGVDDAAGARTVLTLQRALMPFPGREFPHEVQLEHDYLGYYRSATRELYRSGRAGRPSARLVEFASATFVVGADPLGLCDHGMNLGGDAREEVLQSDFHLGTTTAHELASPLNRWVPVMSGMVDAFESTVPQDLPRPADPPLDAASLERRVELQRSRPRRSA